MAMAMELGWRAPRTSPWARAARRQGREVANPAHRAADIPTDWRPCKGVVNIPEGTDILVNATTLGCAPEAAPVPVAPDTVGPDMTAVDVITHRRESSNGPDGS